MARASLLVGVLVVLSQMCCDAHAVTCLDEQGNPVEWWFAYKLPRSLRYAYRDVNSADAGTPLDPVSGPTLDCGNSGCALGYTLAQIFDNKETLAYVAYNDEAPASFGFGSHRHKNTTSSSRFPSPSTHPRNFTAAVAEAGGHTKGMLATSNEYGFWLVHSVPKFPQMSASSYSWGAASTDYGQSFLCVSMSVADINGVAKQLQVTHPGIYSSHVPSDVEPLAPNLVDLVNGQVLQGTSIFPWNGMHTRFVSFTKAPTWGADLYEDLVIPGLSVSAGFNWETWRRSPFLPTYCQGVDGQKYTSANINYIALGSDPSNAFKYTDDHSKWGVSLDSNSPYVCVGDINRMQSQRNRGGGTVCFSTPGLWKSLTMAVSSADTC